MDTIVQIARLHNARQRLRQVSVFGRDYTPLVVRFYLNHWLEMVALSEASNEESVRDLRESLRYEFDHVKPGRIPCLCQQGVRAPAVLASSGGGAQPRSFSDIVPSIETAYRELPIAWRGRTKAYLLMLGHTEQEIYDMRQKMPGELYSPFDREHAARMRSEIRRPGFRGRPQDSDEETTSPFRRMAEALGWRPREIEAQPYPEQEQAA